MAAGRLPAGQEPVKIGVVLSLSGPAAVFGMPERDSIIAMDKEFGGKVEAARWIWSSMTTRPTRPKPRAA